MNTHTLQVSAPAAAEVPPATSPMTQSAEIKHAFSCIDHLAIAVSDLESAVCFYRNTLGMALIERRETKGRRSGMVSAVMDAGAFQIVLVQGVGADSQVGRYIENFGQGVQHVAFKVENIERVAENLTRDGLRFSTGLLVGPGLKQIFSERDAVSGMMYELIERTGESGFQDNNVNQLFEQLEASESY
jgi:methylmalonyl-CoA/ethylmalonyl-CoA epimerase